MRTSKKQTRGFSSIFPLVATVVILGILVVLITAKNSFDNRSRATGGVPNPTDPCPTGYVIYSATQCQKYIVTKNWGTYISNDQRGYLVRDSQNNIYTYIKDAPNGKPGIWKYPPAGGAGALFAALPTAYSGSAYQEDMVLDSNNNLYVFLGYSLGNYVFKVSPAGVITQLYAGTIGTETAYSGPIVDTLNNVYFVATNGTQNHLIRKITPAGIVSNFATFAIDDFPHAIALDSDNNLYAGSARVGGNIFSKFTPAGVKSPFTTTPSNTPLYVLEMGRDNNIYYPSLYTSPRHIYQIPTANPAAQRQYVDITNGSIDEMTLDANVNIYFAVSGTPRGVYRASIINGYVKNIYESPSFSSFVGNNHRLITDTSGNVYLSETVNASNVPLSITKITFLSEFIPLNGSSPPPVSCKFYTAGAFTNVLANYTAAGSDTLKTMGNTELGRYLGSTKKAAFESKTSFTDGKFMVYYTFSGTTPDTVSPQVNKYLNAGGKVLMITDGVETPMKYAGAANEYITPLGKSLMGNSYLGVIKINSTTETREEFKGLTSLYLSSAAQIAYTRISEAGTFPPLKKYTCQYAVTVNPKPTYCVWGQFEFTNGATLDLLTSAAALGGGHAEAKTPGKALLQKYSTFACTPN